MMAPTIEKISEEYKDLGISIQSINVDDNLEMAKQYGVKSIPTLVFEKSGKEVDRTIGNQKYEDIVSRIKLHS